METHPAHTPLPYNAHTDALDALTWSYTGSYFALQSPSVLDRWNAGYSYPDRVLKSRRPARPPFTQEECQELMGMLRSLASESFSTFTALLCFERLILTMCQLPNQTSRRLSTHASSRASSSELVR